VIQPTKFELVQISQLITLRMPSSVNPLLRSREQSGSISDDCREGFLRPVCRPQRFGTEPFAEEDENSVILN